MIRVEFALGGHFRRLITAYQRLDKIPFHYYARMNCMGNRRDYEKTRRLNLARVLLFHNTITFFNGPVSRSFSAGGPRSMIHSNKRISTQSNNQAE